MIDLETADLITLRDAAKLVPGRPHVSTLVRWSRGLKCGRRLVLVKIGGRLFTSRKLLREFLAMPTNDPIAVVRTEVSRNRQEQLARIDRQLTKEGL
jgi:hypothetical protein